MEIDKTFYNMIAYITILLIFNIICIQCDKLSDMRAQLEKKYPGYGKDFVIFPGEDGKPVFAYLRDTGGSKFLQMIGTPSEIESKIHFKLFNRKNLQGVNVTQFKDLSKYLEHKRHVKVVTHGWMSSGKAETCVEIKDNYLNMSDVDVFIMDWGEIADNIIYTIPMSETFKVGTYYAKFLNHLIEDIGIDPKQLHLIGHSLGAHVSGFAARQISKGRIGRITGLDPAMPGFENHLVRGGRLSANDSHFVDVIHTCAGLFGIKEPIGHADFYPNGGTPPQPGCGILDFLDACSHGRSWKLFADSILIRDAYMATKCRSYMLFEERHCTSSEEIPMGEATPSTARGVYYLKTGNKEPFLLDPNKTSS